MGFSFYSKIIFQFIENYILSIKDYEGIIIEQQKLYNQKYKTAVYHNDFYDSKRSLISTSNYYKDLNNMKTELLSALEAR